MAVLDADPDLGEDLSDEQLAIARERALAEVIGYRAGPWMIVPDDLTGRAAWGSF